MKLELQEKIYNDFSNFFPLYDKPNEYGYIRVPIAVGDGWFNLIYNLLEDIDIYQKVQVLQIKEKFGGLRFYINTTQIEIHNLIDKAEIESYNICESCGTKKNVMIGGGWIKTLCKDCLNGSAKGLS